MLDSTYETMALLDSTHEPTAATQEDHERLLDSDTTSESLQNDSESTKAPLDVRLLQQYDFPSPAHMLPNNTQMEPQYELQQEKTSSDDKQNKDGDAKDLADESVRTYFYRRVYGTLACQMLAMAALVACVLYDPLVKNWVQEVTTDYPIIWAAPITPVVSYLVALVFASDVFLSVPENYIFLVITTLAKSFLLGFISCYYDTLSIFMALALTAVVFLIQTYFGKRTGYGIFTSFAVVPLVSYCVFWSYLLREEPDQVTALVCASLSPIIFAFILAYFMTEHEDSHPTWAQEYIFAALNFDWEVIQLILLIVCLLLIIVVYFYIWSLKEMYKSCCGDEENQDVSYPEDIEKGISPALVDSDFCNAKEMINFISRCEGDNEELGRSRNVNKNLISAHVNSDLPTKEEMICITRCKDEKNKDVDQSEDVEKSLNVNSVPNKDVLQITRPRTVIFR